MIDSAEIDSSTVAYIVQAQKYFEDLRQVSAQLAGLLVLSAAGSTSAGPHHPLLESADRMFREAVEAIHKACVTDRARGHHEALLKAAGALERALSATRKSPAVEPALLPLRLAYEHLQRASRELPGFPIVAFEQGCCGRPTAGVNQ